ncbi:MAG: FAD-binding oxidoreductase [Candidatus Pacebacteria bacterium]|nr:FAD-binding oxidoreductase [Candidatus Paceibacterota bacterium]MBP9851963.1 FAD-binding oxidoreductase [Candidatus Paceibacterota bacterium]
MKDEIKKFFEGDVDDAAETLATHSRDASIFEVMPQLVVYPKHAKDIEKLVQWAMQKKSDAAEGSPDLSISLSPRAAGTCMSGGSLNESIIIDVMRYMNRIGDIRPVAPYKMRPNFPASTDVDIAAEIKVEPGVFYRDLESKLKDANLLLPCFTASKSINALGGMLGNNSGGELTLRYGKMEDYVKELKIVFFDGHEYTVKPLNRRELYTKMAETTREGEIYKRIFDIVSNNEKTIAAAKPLVNKNSAGYYLWNVWRKDERGEEVFDLAQVIVGSQGTLGIVTEMTLRTVELPEKSRLVVAMLPNLERLGDIVDTILPFSPTSIESYDDKTFSLAARYFREFIKEKGLFGTIKYALRFMPEFGMILRGGVPKLILLIEFQGNDEAILEAKCNGVMEMLKPFDLKSRKIIDNREVEKYWSVRRDSFALLRKHSGSRHTAPFIDDIIVPPQYLPEFLPQINALVGAHKELIYTIAGHAGNGNFHIIPLMDFKNPKILEIIPELSDKVYDLVLRYQGSIDAEHNDGIIRTPYLIKQYGPEVVRLFGEVKKSFDPLTVFNPGKKVGGTLEYMKSHIALEHTEKHSS